jgi:acyl-CoA thioesterase-2
VSGFQRHFDERLELHQIDRDIFTGECHAGAPLRAYGGQIAAQALMAAGLTIADEDRIVHSLHGYFLRPGKTKDSITYLVDRPRDGRSFSTRFVRAVQHGETIFMMTASFASPDAGPDHQFLSPNAPEPESIPMSQVVSPEDSEQLRKAHYPDAHLIDLRLVEGDRAMELIDGRYEWLIWVRITEPVQHSSLVQACALTYLSDLTMVSTALAPHSAETITQQLKLASIDHAVWFHAPVRTDEWLLFAQDTPVARGGHGLARGLFFDTNGILVASCVQESLMRQVRSHQPAH